MNNIELFFDELAPHWDNSDNNYQMIDKLIRKIDIKENSDILDLACGKGVITNKLYSYSKKKVIGIDLSQKMIEGALEKKDANNEYVVGDFINYEFQKKFDLIVIFNAYPHFLNKEELFKKAYNVLKDNGRFVVMHDIAKEKLNEHHKLHALKISTKLCEPACEETYFKKYFSLKDSIDNDECYYMELIKIKC